MLQQILSKKSIRFATMIMAAVVASLLIGCSGSDSSGLVIETGSLAKEQFLDRMDEICKKGRERFDAEFAKYLRGEVNLELSQPTQSATAKALVETVYVPNHERQIDQIISLGAPSGDEEKVTAILRAMRGALDEAERHPLKFVRSISPKYNPWAKALRLARAYGLTSCGRG